MSNRCSAIWSALVNRGPTLACTTMEEMSLLSMSFERLRGLVLPQVELVQPLPSVDYGLLPRNQLKVLGFPKTLFSNPTAPRSGWYQSRKRALRTVPSSLALGS